MENYCIWFKDYYVQNKIFSYLWRSGIREIESEYLRNLEVTKLNFLIVTVSSAYKFDFLSS